jgi:hypothetical protein
MNATIETTPFALLVTILPGPDRKRTASLYSYRITYRNPRPEGAGCVALWEVNGGRQKYQIAVERREKGGCRWHCTCADAVYRGEEDARHVCKHVKGLQALSV